MKALIGEHTDKSTPVKATYESTQRRSHRGEHRGGKLMPKPGSTLCARVCIGNALGHVTDPFCVEIYRKKAVHSVRDPHLYRNLHEKTHMNISEEQFSVEHIQETCRTQIPRRTFWIGIYKKNAHGHFRRAILCGNLQEKTLFTLSGTRIL